MQLWQDLVATQLPRRQRDVECSDLRAALVQFQPVEIVTDYGRQSLYFYDAWGTIGRPTDLTLAVYRGGRRPIDFYWRVHSGVNGSNMPAFYKSLKPEEIWDLVNFVEILPYPKQRAEYGIDID